MTGKEREPFAYSAEPDGSVCFAAFPFGSKAKNPVFYQVGFMRAAPDGSVLASLTFEEPQDYSTWDRFPSVLAAISSITDGVIDGISQDRAKERALRKALKLLPDYEFRARQALARSARLAVQEAVANMLRVSTYEDVMSAVSEAVALQVIES